MEENNKPRVELVESPGNKSVSEQEKEVMENAGVEKEAISSQVDDGIPTIDLRENKTQEPEPQVEQEVVIENKKEEPQPEMEPEKTPTLDDNTFFEYAKNHLGREITNWDDLKETVEIQPELSDELLAFNKYQKETGRGMSDYVKLNRDFDSMKDDSLVMEYMSHKYPGLDSEDLAFKANEMFGENELDEENDIRRKSIAKKEFIIEAKNFFTSQKEKYAEPLGMSGKGVPEDRWKRFEQWEQSQGDLEKQRSSDDQKRQVFSRKTEELFSNKFEGFKYKVGDEEHVFSVKDVKGVKEAQSNVMNFINKFRGEDGAIGDAEGYHSSLFAAMHTDELINHFFELGRSRGLEEKAKMGKNIDMKPQTEVSHVKEQKRVEYLGNSKRGPGQITIKSKKHKN